MSGHVPPPGAEKAIDDAAHTYLVKVQEEVGSANRSSVLLIAFGGLMRVAVDFGVSRGEVLAMLMKAMRGGR